MDLRSYRKSNYYQGKRLTAADFRKEQAYLESKLETAVYWGLGEGILEGLKVSCRNRILTVEPGCAADGAGRLVLLPATALFYLNTGTQTEPEGVDGDMSSTASCRIEGEKIFLEGDSPALLTIRRKDVCIDRSHSPFTPGREHSGFDTVEERTAFSLRPEGFPYPPEEIPLAVLCLDSSAGKELVEDRRQFCRSRLAGTGESSAEKSGSFSPEEVKSCVWNELSSLGLASGQRVPGLLCGVEEIPAGREKVLYSHELYHGLGMSGVTVNFGVEVLLPGSGPDGAARSIVFGDGGLFPDEAAGTWPIRQAVRIYPERQSFMMAIQPAKVRPGTVFRLHWTACRGEPQAAKGER